MPAFMHGYTVGAGDGTRTRDSLLGKQVALVTTSTERCQKGPSHPNFPDCRSIRYLLVLFGTIPFGSNCGSSPGVFEVTSDWHSCGRRAWIRSVNSDRRLPSLTSDGASGSNASAGARLQRDRGWTGALPLLGVKALRASSAALRPAV